MHRDVQDRAQRLVSFLPSADLFEEIDRAAGDELTSPADYVDRLIAGLIAKNGRLPTLKDLA